MARLTAAMTSAGGGGTLELKGILVEGSRAVLESATAGAPKTVAFDWDGVVLASSDGLREWVQFLQKFAAGREMRFDNVRPALVTSLNMIPSCLGGARVESLYATFRCTACRKEHDVLLTVGPDVSPEGALLKTVDCEACHDGETELLIPEDEYFRLVPLNR